MVKEGKVQRRISSVRPKSLYFLLFKAVVVTWKLIVCVDSSDCDSPIVCCECVQHLAIWNNNKNMNFPEPVVYAIFENAYFKSLL